MSAATARLSSCDGSSLLASVTSDRKEALTTRAVKAMAPVLIGVAGTRFIASLNTSLVVLGVFSISRPMVRKLPRVSPRSAVHRMGHLAKEVITVGLRPTAVGGGSRRSI